MLSVLITGAESGLGLGMVNYLIKHKKADIIFATYLKLTEDLDQISKSNKNVHILHLDVTDYEEINAIPSKITQVVGENGLNLIINNAGFLTTSMTLESVDVQAFLDSFKINTIGPILIIKALLPLLKQAADANDDKPIGWQRAAIVNISTKVASIAQNTLGGSYPYRCSKTAQNAATKSLSIDLKDDAILVAAMHPGWVKTAIGGKGALIDVETSINGIFDVIQNLREENSGKFYEYNGTELPW